MLIEHPTTLDAQCHQHPERPSAAGPISLRSTRSNEFQIWWSAHVCPAVTHSPSGDRSLSNSDARDYLALERTYLARFRTASALVQFGVVLVQLFHLRDVNRKVGLVMGTLTAGGGAVIVLTGNYRYFLQQKELLRGKAVAGGLGTWIEWAILMGVVTAVLVLVLVKD